MRKYVTNHKRWGVSKINKNKFLKPGMRFGSLTVIGYFPSESKTKGKHWVCKCDCGSIMRVDPWYLLKKQNQRCNKCVNITHNASKTRLYAVWNAMINRCANPKVKTYHRYGGRGISVCEEWKNFEAFREWAYENGYDDHADRKLCTIDRINNDGNYEPSNCRWTDMKTQVRNRTVMGR